ncbi:MAG: radical SAM protein [Treponema sp.]|jgi:putative pyruvate formate lyase activating enzyme|nr:radical SAM protein [Treponema sp.]
MQTRYSPCTLCPRNCGADRLGGKTGYCKETAALRIAAATIHRGEEPPITGSGGSGTIFISGCNLGCRFCQNYQISQEGLGKALSPEAFVRLCLVLQEEGAENINLVTGSHAVPALAAGITAARSQGLSIPVLWNSSAYELPSTLSLMESVLDLYLPDLKTLDPALGARFFHASDYPEHAQKSILWMLEKRPLRFTGAHRLVSGVLIRHLVLPDYLESTKTVLQWFAEKAQGKALLSVMMQYTPVPGAPGETGNPPNPGPGKLDRYVHTQEYEQVLAWLDAFAITEGFYQELVPDTGWIPDFSRFQPFSSDLSRSVWHWKEGYGAIAGP